MESAWSKQQLLDYQYSRAAVREVRRRSGISRGRIPNLDKRAEKLALECKYDHPPIQLGERLLPVVISDDSNTPGR